MGSSDGHGQDLGAGGRDAPAGRSTIRWLLAGQAATAAAVASLAVLYVSSVGGAGDAVSQEQLDGAIAGLEQRMLQDRQPATAAADPRQAPGSAPLPAAVSADDDPVMGDPGAPVTIVEFSDFQCPFCARFHVQTLPLIMEEYIDQGKAKLVFRDFPIRSIHPNAMLAALAGECAYEQGGFKPMHDMLFDNQRAWSGMGTDEAALLFAQYASAARLDRGAFESCLLDGRYVDEIMHDLEDGRQYGIGGTPGFFIGSDDLGYTKMEGAQPIDSFRKVIDAYLGAG